MMMQMTISQVTPVTALLTRLSHDFGMKENNCLVVPPETKLRSAGMMGSLRVRILMWFAIAKTVITVPKIAVAIQKRFIMRTIVK